MSRLTIAYTCIIYPSLLRLLVVLFLSITLSPLGRLLAFLPFRAIPVLLP